MAGLWRRTRGLGSGIPLPARREGGSALRPSLPDRVAQHFIADRALEDLVADDEGRGAGGLEVAGELEIALELAVRGRGGYVAAQADGGARAGERLRGGPAGGEQAVVEGLEAAGLGGG